MGVFKPFYLRKISNQTLRGRNKNAGHVWEVLGFYSQGMWPTDTLYQLAVNYPEGSDCEGNQTLPGSYLEKEVIR